MKYDYLNVVGLMTGTSMDGIDISLVETNGLDLKRSNQNYFYGYSNETKDYLFSILGVNIQNNLKQKKTLDELITLEHIKALENFDILKNIDLIGFHGQTIYHNSKTNTSIQLGDPKKLARKFNKDVVFHFRSKDIESGGQGAPLAPIYHQKLIESFEIDQPACILNIGGVSNITFWDGETLIGFDTGPGNALMDNYIQKISDKYFDKNGTLASKGVPKKSLINKFLKHNFFKKPPPKSLDRNEFLYLYEDLIKNKFSVHDTMATLAEITVESIFLGIKILPKKIKNIIVTGGGYKNKYLMKRLSNRLQINIINEEEINVDFDFIEAELIAFLSARCLYNLPFTFPSTTGVSRPLSGGIIYTTL